MTNRFKTLSLLFIGSLLALGLFFSCTKEVESKPNFISTLDLENMTEEEIYQHIKQTQLTGKDLKKKIEMRKLRSEIS